MNYVMSIVAVTSDSIYFLRGPGCARHDTDGICIQGSKPLQIMIREVINHTKHGKKVLLRRLAIRLSRRSYSACIIFLVATSVAVSSL